MNYRRGQTATCRAGRARPKDQRVKLTAASAALAAAVAVALVVHPAAGQKDLVKQYTNLCRVRTIDLTGHGGEENWSSLAVTADGKALVGLSSRSTSAVLLAVDPDTGRVRRVVDLAKVGHLTLAQRQPKIHVTPVRDGQGWNHFFSHFGLDTHLPLLGSRIGYEGMRRWRWHSQTGRAEDLGLVMPAEGAIALNSCAAGRKLFVVTFPKALLLEIDSRTGETRNFGRTNATYAPRHVLVDPWDNPYVLDHEGRFWAVIHPDRTLRPLGVKLPVGGDVCGNLLAQGLVATAELDGRSACLVMSAWGQLYEVRFAKPGRLSVMDHGRPADGVRNPDWRPVGKRLVTAAGLAVATDGRVYVAISGYNKAVDQSGDSYIISCRRDGRDVRLVARLDGERAAYVCGSNAVDRKSGRVFFVGSHLTKDCPCLIVLEGLKG